MKVYLDACCLSRLTDDQLQNRIRREAEAIEELLIRIRQGVLQWISSEALEDEVRRNPSVDRRIGAQALMSLATRSIAIDDGIAVRASVLVALGYGAFDALHVAAAEAAAVDVLLTTDDRLLRRAANQLGNPRIPLRNPLSWKQEALRS